MTVSFGALEFLLTEPNRISDLGEEWQFFAQRLDFKTGAVTIDKHAQDPSITREWSFLLEGKKEIKDFREFINRRNGQQIPFWAPTWQKDFEIIAPLSTWDVKVKIRPGGYSRTYGNSPNRKRIIILKKDGRYITKGLLGIAWPAPDHEMLILDDNIGETLDPKDISMVCFLNVIRLASDDVEWTWHSADCAEVSIKVKESYQLEVE